MINKTDVEFVAELSKLKFNDAELADFAREFDKIIEYVNSVKLIDTSAVEQTITTINAQTDLREDVVVESLSQEMAVKNAPVKDKGMFSVPAVIE